MRCSYHRKKHPEGHSFACPAFISASVVDQKYEVKKIITSHTHKLLNSQEIEMKLVQSRKAVPEKIRETGYRLFIEGKGCKEIYDLIQKPEYHQSKCPFGFEPFKNYLYDRNKKEAGDYDNIAQIYQKLQTDDGAKKMLLMKTLDEKGKLLGLAFTFKEQVQYGI